MITRVYYLQFLFLLFIYALLLSNCNRRVDVSPEFEPAIALEGWWYPEDELSLEVSNVGPINGTGDDIRFLHEATVKVWEDETYIGVMKPDSFSQWQSKFEFFLPGYFPRPGHSYRTEVSAPGLPTAEASTSIPKLPQFSGLRMIKRESNVAPGADSTSLLNSCTCTFEVDLHDLPGEENFYVLNWISFAFTPAGSPTYTGITHGEFEVLDQSLLDDSGLISDRAFADGTVTVRFKANTVCWSGEAKIVFSVAGVPIEYVQNLRATPDQSYSENPLIEPFRPYSNVIGGYGKVLGFSSSSDSIFVTF